jgi:hypothetical protein
MVRGTIQDFYTASQGPEKSVIKILLRVEELAANNSCTVCAEIPNDALKFNMVKAGAPIGWEETKVYIDIEGVENIPFKKIGKVLGDEVTFYEHLRSINKLQER